MTKDNRLFSLGELNGIMADHGVFLGGSSSVLLEDDAVRIFGREAVNYVLRMGGKSHFNTCCFGGGRKIYTLRYEGVKLAASRHNFDELERRLQPEGEGGTNAGHYCPGDVPESTTIIDIKVKRKHKGEDQR